MVFLPPLLFEAGWTMKWTELQEEILPVSMQVGGVLMSIAGVGGAASVHGRSLDDSSTRRGCNRFRRCNGLLRK